MMRRRRRTEGMVRMMVMLKMMIMRRRTEGMVRMMVMIN